MCYRILRSAVSGFKAKGGFVIPGNRSLHRLRKRTSSLCQHRSLCSALDLGHRQELLNWHIKKDKSWHIKMNIKHEDKGGEWCIVIASYFDRCFLSCSHISNVFHVLFVHMSMFLTLVFTVPTNHILQRRFPPMLCVLYVAMALRAVQLQLEPRRVDDAGCQWKNAFWLRKNTTLFKSLFQNKSWGSLKREPSNTQVQCDAYAKSNTLLSFLQWSHHVTQEALGQLCNVPVDTSVKSLEAIPFCMYPWTQIRPLRTTMATVIQQARATTAFVQKAGKYYNVTPPDIHLLHTCVRSIPFHVVVTNGQLCVWEFHLAR